MQPSPLDPSLTVKTDSRFSGGALQFTAAKRAVQQRTAVLHFNPSQPRRGLCCCSLALLPLPLLSLGLQPEKLKVPGFDHHQQKAKRTFSPLPLLRFHCPPPPKPFTPLHYTNKANQPSSCCSHRPGRTCQPGQINGSHQRARAAHKPSQRRAREITPLPPYIFHEIIRRCSVLPCG